QTEFEKNGYIILPFYNDQEITELVDLYHSLHPQDEKGFFPSTFSRDKSYRHTADQEIRRVCRRSIEAYCRDIKVMCGSFIVKSPGPESGMCVHQDMSLIDESRYTGINIWVPLCDLTIENGALFVIPGSHRIMPTYRSSSIPEFFAPVMDEIIDYLQPVLIPAGHAVFFDQSIIHYSPPNYSDKIRIVTNTYFAHQSTEFRTYYWNQAEHGKTQIEAFAQDDSFMTDFEQFGDNIRDRPKVGRSLGLVSYDFPAIDTAFLSSHFPRSDARALIAAARPAPVAEASPLSPPLAGTPARSQRGLLQRIKDLIS
ncbi:MAG: phytanoyl-CoA dioxygenase family protein, partial [Bacteroidetes bacterium]|nr:phytanoyl-CoA dioxygenase family protein [Bacteroidota bacterium]